MRCSKTESCEICNNSGTTDVNKMVNKVELAGSMASSASSTRRCLVEWNRGIVPSSSWIVRASPRSSIQSERMIAEHDEYSGKNSETGS
jgi:hypothetical protein